MKHKLIASIITLSVVAAAICAPFAYADELKCGALPQEWCSSAKTGGGDVKNSGIFKILTTVIQILTGGVGIAAVGAFIYAGMMYSSAQDRADQVKKAKDIMVQTTLGLVAFGLMVMILNWLIPGGVFG